MAYHFDVRHTPGVQNAVADWLSRAMKVCAVEEVEGPSTSLRDFFAGWRPEGEAAEEAESTQEDEAQDEDGVIPQVDEIVNDKRRQLRWKSKQGGLSRMDFRKEKNRRIIEVESAAAVTKPQMSRMLDGVFKGGKTYHIYIGNEVIWRKFAELYREGRIGAGSSIIRCQRMVQTMMDPERQRELAHEYHVGKTNHRGAREMVRALQRRYYWDAMGKTVEQVVRGCEVCGAVKADTRPPVEIQEVTPTAARPLQQIEVDTYIWQGRAWVTIIDKFSKFAQAYPRTGRPAEDVLRALEEWWRCYGVPEEITADGGAEFRGDSLRQEVARLGIRWHTTTPGHTQGRGCVERVHGTLSDHLRLLQLDQQVTGEDAMRKAIIAYNHSIHSTTGYSPIELLFGGAFGRRDEEVTAPGGDVGERIRAHCQQVQQDRKKARGRITEEKERRVLAHNLRTSDVTGKLRIGATVYRRIPTNRRKEVARYTGPYRVVAIMRHNRFTLESVAHPGRTRVAHLSQLKLPRAGSEECVG